MRAETFAGLVAAWIALAVAAFVSLILRPAPYGRYRDGAIGPTLAARAGWLVMEAPAAIGLACWYVWAPGPVGVSGTLFLGLFEAHYVYRSFVYPFLLGRASSRIPLAVVAGGALFNIVNASLHGYGLFVLSPRPDAWLRDPRLMIGVLVFIVGAVVHVQADRSLRALRRGDPHYRIPTGTLFRHTSCPNYLGEIVEWSGWAIATWSGPGLAFAVWTAANLGPRARAHHRWYRARFPDYPPGRKALVPGVY